MSRIHGIDVDELPARGVHALPCSRDKHWAGGRRRRVGGIMERMTGSDHGGDRS